MADKLEIDITYKVDGNKYTLEGLPSDVWKAFVTESKLHFPDAGEDAPFHYLSSVITATISSSSYFMTDIPRENAKAISDIMGQVGWEWDNFHAYLLRAAVLPDHLRIVSLHTGPDEKQEFGTLIVTGLKKSVFDNFEKASGRSMQVIIGSLMIAAEKAPIVFHPDTTFYEPT